MDAVPVLAGGYGHSRDREKFVQFVKRGREAAPPGNSGGGAYLHRLVKGRAEKEPGQEGRQRGVGGSEVDGAAYCQTVTSLELRGNFIDGVVKDALALFCALAAGDAATNGLVPDLNDLGFNPLCLKSVSISRRAREVLPLGRGLPLIIRTFLWGPPWVRVYVLSNFPRGPQNKPGDGRRQGRPTGRPYRPRCVRGSGTPRPWPRSS